MTASSARSLRSAPRFAVLVALALGAPVLVSACETERPAPQVVGYTGALESTLRAQCLRCHAPPAPAAGWSAASWTDAISCTASGGQATAGSDPRILVALARPDHVAVVADADRARLSAWVASGAPYSVSGGGAHPPAFADPRSPTGHAELLRATAYRAMLDPADSDACGVCHDGAARPSRVVFPAPGAPSCASCHAQGALGCPTCHGPLGMPPRSACFHPGENAKTGHAQHVAATPTHEAPLVCDTCHPSVPLRDGLWVPVASAHANGTVEVDSFWSRETGSCDVSCHGRGGARPRPVWGEAAVGCGDCHGSPPAGHYLGACDRCHREANGAGTQLSQARLHMNGRVDVGDGSGLCGACHGEGSDPWPRSGAHAAHASPRSSEPVACGTCHPLPVGAHPRGGEVTVRLAGLAVRGGRRARYEPGTQTCAGTYCHEGRGATRPAPRWSERSTGCDGCHGAPPPAPHTQSAACPVCHAGLLAPDRFDERGRRAHLDGRIQF